MSRLTSDVPATARLIEQQLGNWELARRERSPDAPPRESEVEDFLCISRMVGIDGHAIAASVAQELKWPVFGRELLDAMAGDDRIRKRIYTKMDQRDLTWWEESLRSVLDRDFVRNDYFRRLSETVLSLARQSHTIFVGRGADLILPRNQGLRVRLIASAENRVDQYSRTVGVSPKKARQALEKIEHDRADFFSHRFQTEASDPLRHDLIINLDRWSDEDAVTMILEARARRTGS